MNSWERIVNGNIDISNKTVQGLAKFAREEINNFKLTIPKNNKQYVEQFKKIYTCHVDKLNNTEGITKEHFLHEADRIVENYKVFSEEFVRLLTILQGKVNHFERHTIIKPIFSRNKHEFGEDLDALITQYISDCKVPPINLLRFNQLNNNLRTLMKNYNTRLNEHLDEGTKLNFGRPFNVAATAAYKGPQVNVPPQIRNTKGPQVNVPPPTHKTKGPQVIVPIAPDRTVRSHWGKDTIGADKGRETEEVAPSLSQSNPNMVTNEIKVQMRNDMLLNEYIKNVPNCNGSPLFGDIIMEEIKTTLGTSYKLQNRTGLQKDLYLEKDLEKRKAIVRKFANICNWSEEGVSNIGELITSTSDEDDILIVYGALGEIKGFAKVRKFNRFGDTKSYDLTLLCSNTPNVGSFLLASYMLALKHLNANCGYLKVYEDYYNLPALCLYDKFGFVEDVHSIKLRGGILHLKVELASKSKIEIINTYKKNEGNKIKKTEPLCSPEFKKLNPTIQQEIIQERRQSLTKLNKQEDAKIYRRKTKKRIQQILYPNGSPIDSRKSTPRSNKPSRQPSPLVESQKLTRKSSSTPKKSQKSTRKSNSPEKQPMESQPIQQSINNSLETSLINNVTNSTENPNFSENPQSNSQSISSSLLNSSLTDSKSKSSEDSPSKPKYYEDEFATFLPKDDGSSTENPNISENPPMNLPSNSLPVTNQPAQQPLTNKTEIQNDPKKSSTTSDYDEEDDDDSWNDRL